MKDKFGLFYSDFLKYPLEQRFLLMIPWFASILAGISTIEGLLLNNKLFVISCSLATFIFIAAYVLIKAGKSLRLVAWIMALNTLVLANFVWFSFDGSRGTSPVIILMLLVCVATFFKGLEKITAILLVVTNTIVLLYIEYNFPLLINAYSTELVRLTDMGITFAICALFIIFVIQGTLQSYFGEKAKAGQIDKLKSTFLINISHEIRTPMNAIIGFSNLITQPDTKKKDRLIYSQFVTEACKNLVNLVEEVIDVAKIESNQVNIQKVRSNISEIVKDTYSHFNNSTEGRLQKTVDFHLNKIAIEKNVIIETDPSMIKRVLLNLIDNSIKFTQNGFIEVGYNIRYADILFYVKDTGIGIPEEECNNVFESFQKVEPKNGKLYNGIGLGLTLCKKMLDLLNGKIWVNSKINKGSTFFFTVPYDKIEICAAG
jgi:signal transduction histidine kinase